MNTELFEVDPSVPDAGRIVDEIHQRVSREIQEGRYDDARIGVAERSNLANIREADQYLSFYLRCLHNGARVDINDFEITDQRPGWKGKLLVKVKTAVWKVQKFYTYRMWSQQNQINSFLATAIETTFERYEARINQLEQRIAELERDGAADDPVGPDS